MNKKNTESILKLLEANLTIRVLDGRCPKWFSDGFVDKEALKYLIDNKKVDVYRVNGMQFVRKLERK